MLLYVYLLFAVELVTGQKQSFRGGNRYAPIPYYNLGPKPGSGVGVLQDLSNARILSNEPFIISFEFPKLIGTGESRKNRFGAKRSKSQRKKTRKPRQFRHIVIPEQQVLERRKRLEIMRRPPGLEDLRVPNLVTNDWRSGKSLLKVADVSNPSERSNYGRLTNFEAKDTQTVDDLEREQPVPAINPFPEIKKIEEGGNEEMESVHQKNWENIKNKWISLFARQKEGSDNEVDENEERLKVMSRKMWANCQLLKLLKAPQKNPYFYKLLPPNYPALIMDEEKQFQCNKFYDVTDLARDKQMIAEKIEQLERILSPGNDSGMRKKREAPGEEEAGSEKENTLQDETLQGKLEGEVRSDRSKRTKERQHIRRQRSKDTGKERTRKVTRPVKSIKESRRSKSDRQETTESDDVKRSRRKDSVNEAETKKILQDDFLKPEEETSEKKREKQEIKTGKYNGLQDVFSPSEVNKVIRQKEIEANIFDKVLRAMKKFEDNNPYDESFRPQKRESGNSTESTAMLKNDTDEAGWELEDTIKKLAKIFKILGVKAEAAKKKACTNCDESGESSSEESNEEGKKLTKSRVGKSSKCTCAECPFCQNCLQCFKECRKAALAAKNSFANNQTPVSLPQVAGGKVLNGEKEYALTSEKNGRERDSVAPQDHAAAGERLSNVKLERMYRSKLPPSRDLVRVYFDNPENKLLVWTKRGRRTMPWGPLTSDLQLYRDRARQILKSAEDILHRIRETEEKIHTGQYEENQKGESTDKNSKIKDMDDIIQRVVSEDETKNLLRTPWEAELEKGVVDGSVVQSNLSSKNFGEMTFNIFKDGAQERMELPKESLTLEDEKRNYGKESDKPSSDAGESRESYEVGRVEAAEPKLDDQSSADEIKLYKDKAESAHGVGNTDWEGDGESVEAAVLPVEKKEEGVDHQISLKDHIKNNAENLKGVKQSPDGWEKNEAEENEDVPARVEAINTHEAADAPASKIKLKVNTEPQTQGVNVADYTKKNHGKPGNVQQADSDESEDDEKSISDVLRNVKNTPSDESQSMEKAYDAKAEVKKSYSGESGTEEVYNGESQEVERAFSAESEEVSKSYNRESSEERAYSGESQSLEGSNNVAKNDQGQINIGESQIKERTSSGESDNVESTSIGGESREVEGTFSGESEEIRKAYSGEPKEREKAYSSESRSVERAQSSSESEELEKSAEKMVGELKKIIKQGETKVLPSKKGWQDTTDMEKNAENVIKELKQAMEIKKDQKLLGDKEKEKSAEVDRSEYEKDESDEPFSYEDEEEVERKDTKVKEGSSEAVDNANEHGQETPKTGSEESHVELEETGQKSHGDNNPFEDSIKTIEENYIIKGVKQTKEEKEAILKALLNVEKKDEQEETTEVVQETGGAEEFAEEKGDPEQVNKSEKPIEQERDSLKTVVEHLEKGRMDENDFDAIKKLDESQFDLLVGEMQKNDEKGVSINCETRMKLCQAVCSCRNNGTDSDLTKYEIIKGFLGWLKDLNVDKLAPITA